MPPKESPSAKDRRLSLPNQEAFDFLLECQRRKARYDLSAAIPFEELSEGIREIVGIGAARNAASIAYDASTGLPELLSECVEFFRKQGIECTPSNVAVTNPILDAIEHLYDDPAIIKKDEDVVLVPYPTFGYYLKQLVERNIKYELFETSRSEGFQINAKELRRKIDSMNPRPKILLLCYPNNPTGAGMNREVAIEIVKIAKTYGITIISDEVYMAHNLAEKTHCPIASVPGGLDCSITLTNISKLTGVTGVRQAIVLAKPEIIKKFAVFQGLSAVDQGIVHVLLQEYNKPQSLLNDEIEKNRIKYLTNIALIKSEIKELSEIVEGSILPVNENPQYGNIYLIDFSTLRGMAYCSSEIDIEFKTGLDVSRWLYEKAGVAVVPGECSLFGAEDMMVRIGTGVNQELLSDIFKSIKKAAQTTLLEYHKGAAAANSEARYIPDAGMRRAGSQGRGFAASMFAMMSGGSLPRSPRTGDKTPLLSSEEEDGELEASPSSSISVRVDRKGSAGIAVKGASGNVSKLGLGERS